MQTIKRKLALALASTAFLAPIGVQTVTSAAEAMCPPDNPCPGQTTPSARDQIITRAHIWLDANGGAGVPYSQDVKRGGYRTDCSGYVSMVFEFPKGEWGGPNTQALASSTYTTPMLMKNLKKGDLVIDAAGTNTTRHVVIFEKWANTGHTSYWSYEQRGSGGTTHTTHNYGLVADDYNAYRPNKLS